MSDARYTFGPFVLHPGRELQRDGRPVAIGQRALLMLETMLAADGAVVTKSDLMAKVWPGMIVEEGNITVQMAALRRELGQDWIVTVPRVGYRLVRPTPGESPANDGGRPALAVLPFVNLSGETSRDYVADGLVEDLITAFSRFKTFAVVSRNSSFVYKGRAVDVRQVSHDLGVRYLLEGSVRLAENRVRVTVQLIDAASGTHHWASSFDGEMGEVFQFQDKVTEAVVGLVEPQIRRAEIERARRRWPDSPQAYDHYLRALPHFYSRDPSGYRSAFAHLQNAISLQPDYALALAYASWALARGALASLDALSKAEEAECIDLARKALLYDDGDPLVLAVCGHSLLAIGDMKAEGLATARRALKANPHNVTVLLLVGICNMLAGDLDEAETCYRRAYQLSPGALEASESLAGVGFSKFFKGDYEGAINWLEQSRATLADWPPTFWMLAASYAQLGQRAAASAAVARLLEIAPNTTVARVATIAKRSDERFNALLDGLRKAGLQ